MTTIHKFCLMAASLILLAACSATPTPSAENGSAVAPSAAGENQAAPAGDAAAQPYTGPITTQSSGNLTVNIFSDEDVEVTTPEFTVAGTAPTDTILTINDEIVVVDKTQSFSVVIPLEEGPNAIEIVGSDVDGDEVNFELTVTYTVP